MTSRARLVERLQRALDGAASPSTKRWWESYLKHAIAFRGVGIPAIRSIVTAWRADEGIHAWPRRDQLDLALHLLEQTAAEDKLAGVLFIEEFLLPHLPWREALGRYGTLYDRGLIADWNTCDWFCVRVLGPMIAAHGTPCARAIARWSGARNLWQARSSVVPFVKVIGERRHHPLLLASCATLIRREERFAKTGVGWVLRDLSKHDPDTVAAFVAEHIAHFSTESLKNALKYSTKAEQQRALLRLKAQRHGAAPRRSARR